MNLVSYGSDSEESGNEQVSRPAPSITRPQAVKETLGGPASSLPKPRRRDGPIKIALEAPKRPAEDEITEETRPSKRQRPEGAGGSSLLSMLPAPKNKKYTSAKKVNTVPPPALDTPMSSTADALEDTEVAPAASSLSLLPPSRINKGKEKQIAKEEEPVVDFFSLAAPTPSTKLPIDPTTFNKTPSLLLKSAAPNVKEFVPPAPTPTDPYPGYYQKPDGQWAAHDPTYYWSVAKAWLPAEEPEPSSKKRKEWEGDGEDLQQVSALDEASKTRAEIEVSKSITANVIRAGPSAPNMTMTEARTSHRAKSRHQLSTLLTDAYSRRAELEDKLSVARRNRKESGNKYGF